MTTLRNLYKIVILIVPLLGLSDTRIVDGSIVSSTNSRWDSTVSLQSNTTHICGGTLISPLWVLSAVHCALDSSNQLISLSHLSIAYGSYQLDSNNMKRYEIEKVIPYPYYNPTTNSGDIVLIKLKEKIQLDRFPSIDKGLNLYDDRESWIAGWGSTSSSSGLVSNSLREAKVAIVDRDICNGYFAYNNSVTSDMICAGYMSGGSDSCSGDSGGGLVTYEGGELSLIGITSWGRGCGERYHPGIYTSIDSYYNWIIKYTQGSTTTTTTETTTTTTTTNLVSTDDMGEITKLYVATFNRAPDKSGIEYWLNSKLSIEQIAMSFFEQKETQELYPPSTQEAIFVKSIYSNLFNREPDIDGWIYWIDAINSGTISRSLFILAVINGAKDDDAIILANKQIVGEYFANKGLEDVDDARGVISSITSSKDSVDEAFVMVDSM